MDFKEHLFAKHPSGTGLRTDKTACGKRISGFNVNDAKSALKSNAFRKVYNEHGDKVCCKNCVAKAIEEKRFKI